MIETSLTITSRERLRREIAQQMESFLRDGGRIEVVPGPNAPMTRPIGPVWWDSRGSSLLSLGA